MDITRELQPNLVCTLTSSVRSVDILSCPGARGAVRVNCKCAADFIRTPQVSNESHPERRSTVECLIKVGASHSLLGRCLTRLVPILCLPPAEYVVYWLAIVVSC